MNLLELPEFRAAQMALGALEPVPESPHIPVVVVWGLPGCGRTTLLRKLATEWRKHYGKSASLLCRGSALATRRLPDKGRVTLRRLKELPLVVIDDFASISPKVVPRFATLMDHRNQERHATALSLATPPSEIQAPSRVVERLVGALVVEIPPLTAESRRQALSSLLTRHGVRVGKPMREDLEAMLAPTIGGIDRQVRALADAASEHLAVDEALARCRRAAGTISLEQIISVVASETGNDRKAMTGPARLPGLVKARQLVIVLARSFTELSLAKLGRALGGRDPATLRHAIESFHVSCEPTTLALLKKLERNLESLRAGTTRS